MYYSVSMKIYFIYSVLISGVIFIVSGDTDLEECGSLNGVERKCMRQQDCPKDIQNLLDRRQETKYDLVQLNITRCGHQGWKICCPLAECYTWDGRPGQCVECTPSNLNVFANMTLKQKKDSRCLNRGRSLCQSDMPAQRPSDCKSDWSAFPPDPTSGCCGQQYPGAIYGLPSSFYIHPWFAVLKYVQANLHCSGVLISTQYVLTAAHCVDPMLMGEKPYEVILGKNDKDSTEDCLADAPCFDTMRESRPIREIIVHPEFNSASRPFRHDIALIRLYWIVTNSEFTKPICLPVDPTDTFLTSSPLKLNSVGWGGHHDDYLPSVNRKREVSLQFVGRRECMQHYENLGTRQICAIGERNTEVCIGNTGGPLMRDRNGTYEILGIPSFSKSKCGTDTVPTAYTKVHPYAVWIHNTIRP